MPAPFTVRSFRKNIAIRQVHMTLDYGQPNEALFNVTGEVLAAIFDNETPREGEIWKLSAECIYRPGTNGTEQTT